MSKRLNKLFGRNTSSPGREDSRTPPAAKSNHPMQPGPSPSAQGAGASLVKSSSYVAQILGGQAEAKASKSQELPYMPTITQRAREWWKENKATILASSRTVLSIVEKGLDGLPVYGPKAAVAAVVEAVRAIQTMDENKATAEEIVTHVETITKHLVQFGLPATSSLPSASPDITARIAKFTSRLGEIQSSSTKHVGENRNVLVRLMNAEHVATQLEGVWADIQMAHNELIATTVISTEVKVDGARQDMGRMQVTQITQVEYDLLDRLRPVKSAFHDALGSAPACLEGTRTQILDEISIWMTDPSAKLVYWLTGVAGTGKTTIAQSVAHMAEDRGCLAATFFFSRTAGSAERRRAAAVIPTLVYQLAYSHEIFRDCICRAVSSDRDICERLVVKQAKILFADALQSRNQPLPFPLVIVLDALDECDKENGREGGDLIPVLLHSLAKLPFSVKIFITSRPEPSIKNMFGRADIHESTVGRALHRDIEEGIVREDIGRYFRHELDRLAQDRSVPPPFPSDVDFQRLVDRAGNLFIYVRTIVMYVSNEVEDPVDRLADVLCADADSEGVYEQFADLDALYRQILTCALDGVGRNATAQRQLRDVLASLVLIQESLPVTALSALAGVEERQCKKVLRFLSSVLLYDHVSHEPVRLMHPSFPDFLVSASRCTDTRYFVNGAEYHSVLALRCLQIMSADLRRDICDIRDPSLSNANVPNLNQRLSSNVSPQLRYACKYWHVHVQSAGCFHPDLITAMNVFCTKHLLHWLELLSLMGDVPVALRDLPLLLSYLESFDDMHQGRIYTLLTDVDRLLLLYREPIIHSALHVYHSALATMPSCLLLEETAPHDGYGIPLLITKRAPSWGLRETIIDQSDSVYRLTYSPNGKLIAAVAASEVGVWDLATGTALYTWSGNDTQLSVRCAGSVAFSPNGQWIAFTQGSILQVWDVVTGSQQCIMEGYSDTDTALCIAFSPDSTTIVSGSCDHTVRVWDASTGAEQLVMTGHTDCVNALAFAPDGQNIVSASDDGTLRLWDVLSGTELRVIDADSGKLYCVAFSPDGATIASGAENGTIQLWSATSDSRQHALEGHRHGVRSFAFSPDGKSIVSCPTIGSPWIWDATTGIQKRSLRNGVFCVAYSPDGKSVALGLEDGTTRIWDAKTDATTHCATDGHWDPVFCMSFSPDSMLIASGSRDGTVRVWNAITGAERHVIEVGSTVVSVAFSPDSRTIVCCQWKGTVQWWDVASGLEQSSRTGQPHASSVRSVAFSPDSKFMVSYSSSPIGGTAQVWDVVTGAVQHTLTHPVPDTGLSWDRRASFSTDGKAIILRDCSRAIVFGSWDLTTTTHPQYAKSTSPHEPARAIDDLHASEQQDIGLPAPRYLFDKHGSPWIQLDNGQEEPKDICWLPPECRGLMEYSGTKVCVGGRDGAITILDFSPVGLLQ